MSSYLYPIRVQPAYVFPDVEPLIAEPLDADELAFQSLPATCEMLMQRLGDGAVPSGNAFEKLIGTPFAGRPYNAEALDRDIYDLKAELDAVLVREKKCAFRASQLRDILAAEIQAAKDNGYPLLDQAAVGQATADAARDGAIVMADGTTPRKAGLTGYGRRRHRLADADFVGMIGPRTIQNVVGYNDTIASALSYVTPFINLALQVIVNVVTVIVTLAGTATTAGAIVTQVVATAMLTVSSGISAALSSTGIGVGIAAVMQVAMAMIREFARCAAAESMKRRVVKELTQLANQIQASMAEMVQEIEEAVNLQKANTTEAIGRFRAIMGEMVARVQRGERIVGLLTCTSDGSMVLEFSAPPAALPTNNPAIVSESPVTLAVKGAAVALTIVGLVSALPTTRVR